MAGGFAMSQARRFSTQPIPISGRRILSGAKDLTLPTAAKIVAGSLPTGYTDHGSVVQGKVDISVELNVDSIDLGRIPTPHRFYITGQTGFVRANMQEFQPEMVSLAAGQSGTPATATGYSNVYIGGALGSERRVLVVNDFDIDFTNDGYLWDQIWWTTPDGQCGGSFTLAEEKTVQTVIPIEYKLLAFDISGINRLLESRWINHA